MCGGINLSQCIPVADDDNGKTPKNKIIFPSLLYNTGRVISYSVIGFLLGGMGILLTGGGGMGIPPSAGDIENNSGFVHGDHGNKHVGLDYIIKKVPNQISTKAD